MNFYRRRPLALAISLCIAVSAAAAFVPGAIKIAFMALAVILSPIIITFLKRRQVKRICGLSSAPFVLICVSLILCFLLTSFAYYDVFVSKYEKLESGSIIAVVTDVRSRRAYSATYTVRLKDVGEKPMNGKGLLYSEHSVSLMPGDVIKVSADFIPLDEFYGTFDISKHDMLADGYVFACETEDIAETVSNETNFEVFFSKLKSKVSARLSLYVNKESAPLADALFLGDRSGLGKIRRDFSAAGIIHILALSGMHLSVLTGGFDKVLAFLGIGKKFRGIPIILFVAFYVFLTGFLMSVIRASLMLALSFIALLLDANADRVTSLFVAVGLMVLISPAAVFDVSLQLSFFATLGVLLFSEASMRPLSDESNLPGVLKKLFGSVLVSLGAILFILPLQWLYFDEMSLISVPATVIMSVLCEGLLLLYLPYLLCSMAGFHTACEIVGKVIELLSGFVSDTAGMLAQIADPISSIYPFVPALLICLVAIIIYMMIKNYKSWLLTLIPLGAFIILYLGGIGIYNKLNYHDATLDFVSYGTHDAVLAVSNRRALIVDVTDGSSTALGILDDSLAERYITTVETLIITDPTARHASAIRSFMNYRIVKRVFLPTPENKDEYRALKNIIDAATEYGCETVFYDRSEDCSVYFGDITVTLAKSDFLSRSVQPLEVVNFVCGDRKAAYVGKSAWESERLLDFMKDSDYLVFGANGPNFSSSVPFELPPDADVIHVANDGYTAYLGDEADTFDGVLLVGGRFSVSLS